MSHPQTPVSLEEQIDQWRSYLRRREATSSVDVTKLEVVLVISALLADAVALIHRIHILYEN